MTVTREDLKKIDLLEGLKSGAGKILFKPKEKPLLNKEDLLKLIKTNSEIAKENCRILRLMSNPAWVVKRSETDLA